ncbi:hypothetical protein SAMN05216337_10507 [Bradyrhizobium brasilense]|uniref:Uncharacterized protein n=1 Tax=Bradyrhizobium brasilense TaxID=1419277 RepID=A0A1G7JTS5_9BRAD|nr:hypothetical protein SAMN05216337_10507 [Bradyrhizobium brasilense]
MSARARSKEMRTTVVTFRPIAFGEMMETSASMIPLDRRRFSRRCTPDADRPTFAPSCSLQRRLSRWTRSRRRKSILSSCITVSRPADGDRAGETDACAACPDIFDSSPRSQAVERSISAVICLGTPIGTPALCDTSNTVGAAISRPPGSPRSNPAARTHVRREPLMRRPSESGSIDARPGPNTYSPATHECG